MKKILSLLLSAVMLVSASFGTCVSAFADENIFGLDVSEHNELVNFVDAKDNNKNFVMIRLGYVAQNKWILDKKFWENVKNAHNAQMDFGIYFYSYAFNAAEAQYEAEFVIDTLAQLIKNGYGKYFTLPVAFDLEDKLISDHCNKTQITKVMTTFCDTVKNAG